MDVHLQFDDSKSEKKVNADAVDFLHTYQGKVFKYDAEAKAGRIAPMLYDFLAVIDTNKNGELSLEEIEEAAEMIKIQKKAKKDNSQELYYKHQPEAVAKVLALWDVDKNGSVSVSELMMAADAQKRLKNEHRFVRQLLVGAIITIVLLMAGTFAVSFAAVEVAKETKVDQDTGLVMAASGTPAAIGTAMEHIPLTEIPSLGMARLRALQDFSYVHNDVYHHCMLAGFRWHNEVEVELIAATGEVLTISDSGLTLQKPDGQVVELDPEAGRRLDQNSDLTASLRLFTYSDA